MPAAEWLNKLFSGLGQESLKIELLSIIKDMAYEDPSSAEFQQTLAELCQSIVTILQSKGRNYSFDQCMSDLERVIAEERAYIVARLASERIRSLSRKRKSSEGSGISIF